nr:uncharacterized protein LOC121119721 [Lepeophtheirus salmonis]
MPSKCVVPTCKTSYKDVEQKTISIHKFPKRIKMLETWKSAIQRSYNFNIFEEKSLNFSKLVVCSNHFLSRDFETEPQWQNSSVLKRRILKKSAVPSTNLKDGKIEITRPTRIFSAEARRKRSNLLLEALSAGLINRDNINSLVDLKSKIDLKCLPKGVKMEWFDNEVFFMYIEKNIIGCPIIGFSVTIKQDLKFKIWRNNHEIPKEEIIHLIVLDHFTSCSEILNLLAFLKSKFEKKSHEDPHIQICHLSENIHESPEDICDEIIEFISAQ